MTFASAIRKHQYPPRPPIDIFGVIEVGNQEFAYSSALLWLLETSKIGPKLAKMLFRYAGLSDGFQEEVIIQREVWLDRQSRPDLLIRTRTNALAIEAKLFAPESNAQLRRYQHALERSIAVKSKALIFLSPKGIPSETHDGQHANKVISLSYLRLGEMIDQAILSVSRHKGAVGYVLPMAQQIANGFKSVGGSRMHPNAYLGLWAQYPQELDDLTRLAPDLSLFVEDYERAMRAIASRFRLCADFEYFPNSWKPGKAGLREIKCYLSLVDEFAPKAYPCVLFGWYPRSSQTKIQERRPFVRLFVWKQGAAKRRNAKSLAGRLAAAAPKASFDGAVPSVRGWSGWGRLLRETDYPSSAVVGGRSQKAILNSALRHADRCIRLIASARAGFRPR
jgi:hypothetical protein